MADPSAKVIDDNEEEEEKEEEVEDEDYDIMQDNHFIKPNK